MADGLDLTGKVALVTGAGGGLGRAHALALAARGARVVVNDLGGARDGDGGDDGPAEAVAREIREAGGEAAANGDSVSDRAGAKRMVDQAIETFGRLDVVVNNAGILRDKTFAKMALEDFETVVAVHLMGSAYVTHAAWPHMREQKYGRVILTTSSSGLFGNFGQSNYGAAKMGLVGLMNTLKLEGARDNIRVNCLAPTAFSRMTADLMPPEAEAALAPEAVSPAVVFLAGAEAPSGVIIEAGGGYFAKVEVVESQGVFLGLDGTAEALAAAWDQAADMAGARAFAQGSEVAMAIFNKAGTAA